MKLRFLAEALQEYEDAIEYYERAQSGLGDRFIRDVEDVLAFTLEFPKIGASIANAQELDIRRRIVRRFSVEISYLASEDEVVVLAIFHTKRRPGYWHDRLDRLR